MKTLIIIHKNLSNPYTGGQYRLAQVIAHLKDKDIKYQVIDCGLFPEKTRENRIYFILHFVKYYLRYRKNIFTFTDHGTHFRLLIPLFISRIFGNEYGITCLQTFYNFRKNLLSSWIEFFCEYLFLHGAALRIFPSKVALNYFRSFHIEHKNKAIVNPAAKILCKGEIKFRNHVRNLIFVGQVKWWKGLDILIKALAEIKHLDLHLDVAGHYEPHSKYYQFVLRIIHKLKLNNKIVFHGNLSSQKLSTLYENADILILSSRYETFGIVLYEAMSFGLPIIASAIPSTKELIKDRINGIFYETEDPTALAQTIEMLSNNSSLRKQIHKNNLQASVKPRTWKMVADETIRIIKKKL